MKTSGSCLVIAALLSSACGDEPRVTVDASNWDVQAPVMQRDPEIERRIDEMLSAMTLEEKVGQIIQADINWVTPEDVREYKLGSVLNGGSSAPGGDNRANPQAWLDLADRFWDASTDTSDGRLGIPVMWGTDAVHGNNKLVGATLFPHNIGLGAANNPDLMYEVGRVTAMEILPSGLDWTFAPTIAVARNDRWGRTYESYSEDPNLVAAYAPKIISGIQGELGTPEFLDDDHVLATAKHFVGDGGTTDGRDQGDTAVSESELRDIHAAGYPPAIAAGAQVVMASFNSFHGEKMHGSRKMLTDVLVGRMGFDGFVVGDWNGHGQVAGCSDEACARAVNAGLDMFMAPDSWKDLYHRTLEQVNAGEISLQRLDEAVGRVLRVKIRAGILDDGRPSSRKHAGNFDLLGAPEHRAVARSAVRQSLVLLKNNGEVLPVRGGSTVLVAGDGAHDIGKQSGGWTLNWQGTDNLREHFPNGESIWEGIARAVEAAGGTAILSEAGEYATRPDVAIVVFGEDPYAEGVGDRPHLDYVPEDGLRLLEQFRNAGIPTVSVFLSGRPMWVSPEINLSDAFVAAWLPGTEGGGLADVLIGDADGAARFDFTGRLSFSWPATATQANVNVGDDDYEPLFPLGYGLSYGRATTVAVLPEESGLEPGDGNEAITLLQFGDAVEPYALLLVEGERVVRVGDSRASSTAGALSVTAVDRLVQEDAIDAAWQGSAVMALSGPAADYSARVAGDLALEMTFEVAEAANGKVLLGMRDSGGQIVTIDISDDVRALAGTGWSTSLLRLSCFERFGLAMDSITEPFFIEANGPLRLRITSVSMSTDVADAACGLRPTLQGR